jgi:hypothetical protein
MQRFIFFIFGDNHPHSTGGLREINSLLKYNKVINSKQQNLKFHFKRILIMYLMMIQAPFNL